jgi:hypothetical protein
VKLLQAKTPNPTQDKEQIKAFRKVARELGCDKSEERFQEALRVVAKQKPKHKEPKASRIRR